MDTTDCLTSTRPELQRMSYDARTTLDDALPGLAVHPQASSPHLDLQAHVAGDIRVCRINGDRLRFGPAATLDPAATMMASLVISGVCLVRQDGRDVRIGSGQYVFHDLTRAFQADFAEPFDALMICFPEA
ncbi:hypothetical protein, partial [Klebsiella pneumoniae]|uniref:hypothetical protein n=1 Tax=Klebsiella pneumoniae TaxID=573 RepID=UPI00371A85AB